MIYVGIISEIMEPWEVKFWIVFKHVGTLKKIKFTDVMMDFDATSLYTSALYDEKSVYPKIESGFAF